MCFVFLEREAPLLAEPLLRISAPTAASSSPSTADTTNNMAFRKSSALPVLEIVMELTQNVKASAGAPPAPGGPAPGADGASGGSGHGISKVWDVPPRYERLRQAHMAQRAAEAKQQRDAKRMWGTTRNNQSCDDAFYLGGLVEGSMDEREHHYSADALLHVTAEELLRRPPYISAYRVVPLSECPLSIQQRAQIDPQWLREVQREMSSMSAREGSASSGGPTPPESIVASVLPTLFLCWCRLYGSSSGTLLFSDACVLQRSSGACGNGTPSKGRCASSTAAAAGSPNTPSLLPGGTEGRERPALPMHYIQEKLQRMQSAPPESDSERILRLVAQRQLLLQIELKDQQRAINDLPDAYTEDRLGIPRPSAGLSRHLQDVGHAADLWAQNARQHMAPQLESRQSFRGSASRDRSALGSAPRGATLSPHQQEPADIEGRSFLVGDDGAAFCVPQRRVRIGELGRHVDAPEDLSTLISLSAYWGQGPETTASHRPMPRDDPEAALFVAAGGATSDGRPPIRSMGTSVSGTSTAARGSKCRRRPPSVAALHPAVAPSGMPPMDGGVVTFHAGHPWKRQSFWGLSPGDPSSPAAAAPEPPQDRRPHEYVDPTRHDEGVSHPTLHDGGRQGGALDDEHHATPRRHSPLFGTNDNHCSASDSIPSTSSIAVQAAVLEGDRSSQQTDRRTKGGNVEALLVATVRELAPLKAATEELLVDTIQTGHRVEEILSTSAARRQQNRDLLVQAKRAEAQLLQLQARMDAALGWRLHAQTRAEGGGRGASPVRD